jgi:hypothetical protein
LDRSTRAGDTSKEKSPELSHPPPLERAFVSSWADEMAALDPPPEIGSFPLGHVSFEEEAYGPVPEGEDFFLAVSMEPTRAGDGQAEGREEVDSSPDSSLALLQPGESWEVEPAPHQRRGRGPPPGTVTVEWVECDFPQADGGPRRVFLARLTQW